MPSSARVREAQVERGLHVHRGEQASKPRKWTWVRVSGQHESPNFTLEKWKDNVLQDTFLVSDPSEPGFGERHVFDEQSKSKASKMVKKMGIAAFNAKNVKAEQTYKGEVGGLTTIHWTIRV